MKVFLAILILGLLACVYSEDFPDCKVSATPEFSLKYGEAFSIEQACLLVKCRGGQTFEIVSNCPTLFRGAPTDIATQKSKEMGDLILAGKACEATKVI